MLRIMFSTPIFQGDLLVQQVNIIDETRGIGWKGEAKMFLEDNYVMTSIDGVKKIIENALIKSLKGVNSTEIHRISNYVVHVLINKKNEYFLNTSYVTIKVLCKNKIVYTLNLEPYII